MDNHIDHLRAVLECMRTNKLYANASKCIFGAEEILFLGCFIGKRGLRADPAKVRAIVDWPVPTTKKIYVSGLTMQITCINIVQITDMDWPLSNLLKTDVD